MTSTAIPVASWKKLPRSRGSSSHLTPRWRGQSRANSFWNSLLAGKIQAILFVWAPEYDYCLGIEKQIQ